MNYLIDKYIFDQLEHLDPDTATLRIVISIWIFVSLLVVFILLIIQPNKAHNAFAIGLAILSITLSVTAVSMAPKL